MFFRKLRENQESHSLSRVMLEAIPLACSIRNAENHILDCNQEALRIFGLSKKSDLITRFEDLNPEFQNDGRASREKANELLRTALETGRLRFDWMYRTIAGDPLPVEITLVRVPWKNHYCIAAYSRDLRETIANQQKIREADERTRLILDATPLACSLWDEEENFLDCNNEALRMYGLANKSDYVKYLEKLSPPFQDGGIPSMEKMKICDATAFAKGFARFEWMHCTLSGEPLPVETTLVRVPWKGGYALATYSRDLREVKATEQRMREADKLTREMEVQTQAAQAANEAKSRFLASMSHEIRTPMNAIIGMSDLMRTDNLDQTQREYFEDIKKMSRALLQIINDILDFSKIEAGQMDLHPVHFNLLALYDNICSMCRFTAAAKELEFRSVFDAAVPQVIYGDDIRFRQIMVNIVNNAVKYTREGFVEFLVNRVTEDGRDSIAFIVKDTGIGIKQEDFSKIFGAFQQADSEVNRGIIGTGLGLSITKKLVDIMGGTIRLESVYGKGSEFTVLLPLVTGDPSMMEKGDAAESEVSAETADVLVADDNRINLKVALAFLARHAIKADSALNGLEAIGMIQKKHYDLVFMDHMMPEMDGVEATRRIRVMDGGRYKTLPIVALSANAVTGAQETFFEAGMNDFISKPIEANVLNRALLKWLPPEKVTVKKSAAPSPPPRPLCAAVTFNKAAGLEKAMGDEPFYRQLLETFQADHAQDAGKIQEAVRAGNRELAHRLAHTLKSASAQIGGEALSRTAAAMEAALGDKGAGCSPEELQGLGTDLNALLEELHRIPAQDPPDRGRSAEANPQMPDNPAPGEERQVLSLMEELIPLLESGNTASIKRIDDIRKTFPDLEGRTAALIDGIENFEFKTALGILRSIKESWISRQRGEN